MPGVRDGQASPYSFPNKPCPPEDLVYTLDFPEPAIPNDPSSHMYIVQVYATAVTKGELGWAELLEPRRFHSYGGTIPGRDFVGTIQEVVAVKSPVAPKFKKGDQVWGFAHEDREGAAADRIVVLETDIASVPRPPSTASKDWPCSLATVPLSGLTAWQALFQHGNLRREKYTEPPHVLITGAAGSVGVICVQLAKLFGFHVIAVCSSRHSAYLQDQLGVDTIIDYTASDFSDVPSAMSAHRPVSLVIDCVGGETARHILLEPTCVLEGGKIILLAQPLESYGEETEKKVKKRGREVNVDQQFFIVKMDAQQLAELGTLISDGRLMPQLDAVFPLEQGREAVMRIEKKGAVQRGKVVIRVSYEGEKAH